MSANRAVNIPVLFSNAFSVSNRTCVLASSSNVGLPNDPADVDVGDVYIVKNRSGVDSIVVSSPDISIDNASSLTLPPLASAVLCFFGDQWGVLASYGL